MTCMVLTTTHQLPEKIRIGFGPRCYHCGRNHKKTIPCPAKLVEPVCLNCRQKHGPGDISTTPAGHYTQAQSLAYNDDTSQLQPMEQEDDITNQSHACSDPTGRQLPMDQDRHFRIQPDDWLPRTPFCETRYNSWEYSIHSPDQPPLRKIWPMLWRPSWHIWATYRHSWTKYRTS